MNDETLTADQHKQIISYLRTGKALTRWIAMMDLGIAELSSRIGELEAKGYKFEKRPMRYKKKGSNRWTPYKEYKLVNKNVDTQR